MNPPTEMKSLHNVLDRYCNKYRRADFPTLKISGLYDLFPDSEHPGLRTQFSWPDSWPGAGKAGVYFFFDSELTLLYIGKASMGNSLGGRLSSFCGFGPNRKCSMKDDGWKGNPRFVAVISVADHLKFEAPALEEFLIGELQPIDNTIGT